MKNEGKDLKKNSILRKIIFFYNSVRVSTSYKATQWMQLACFSVCSWGLNSFETVSFPLGHPRWGAAGADAALQRAQPDLELHSEVTFPPPDAAGPARGVLAHLGYAKGRGCACPQPGLPWPCSCQPVPRDPAGSGEVLGHVPVSLGQCSGCWDPSMGCWCPLEHPAGVSSVASVCLGCLSSARLLKAQSGL